MKHGLPNETVERISAVLARFPEVDKAVLYGSRAKGTCKPGSDIDLSLSGDQLDGRILARIADQLDDLLLPYKIDLSIFGNISQRALIEHIQRVGVAFYEKQTAPAKS